MRHGAVRRAKLYYLRGLTGKKARIQERAREFGLVAEEGAAAAGQRREGMSAVFPSSPRKRGPRVRYIACPGFCLRGNDEKSALTSELEMPTPRTLFDKIWDNHLVEMQPDGTGLLYIDRHLVHEVTSPQAFEGLRAAGRKVHRPDATITVPDHNVPTSNRAGGIKDEESRIQVELLERNAKEFGLTYFGMNDIRQGIVHIIGPEQGLTQPGMTIVCGDSHTATHGAVGALAFGIGTSEVEHVLATQTLIQRRPKNMKVEVNGTLGIGVTPKDVILAIIGKIGIAGGTGHVIEYAGDVFRSMSMEGRMTVCNMSIEGGARAGLVAPDDITFDYLKGRPYAPESRRVGTGARVLEDAALRSGRALRQDRDARRGDDRRRSSPGAPSPSMSCRSPARSPIPTTSRTRSAATA